MKCFGKHDLVCLRMGHVSFILKEKKNFLQIEKERKTERKKVQSTFRKHYS